MTRVLRWCARGATLVLELALLVMAAAVVKVDGASTELTLLTLWDAVALVYLGTGILVVWAHARHPSPATRVPVGSARRWVGIYLSVFPAITSLMGLTAAVTAIAAPEGSSAQLAPGLSVATAMKAVAAVAMVLAWLVLHVSYGRLYQWLYAKDAGGLEFPGDAGAPPSDVDFLYFAVTLGATFATSDVNVTTTRMRWRVVVHTVVSFFYNTVVLAVGVRILTGG